MPPLQDAYDTLLRAYGPQAWWPVNGRHKKSEPRVEIAVGAILVQHAAWRNAERALEALDEHGLLAIDTLDSITTEELAHHIRSAGTAQVKSRRVKAFARHVVQRHQGSIAALLEGVESTAIAIERRTELLTVYGIGPETADAILLYAGGAPVFVVDAYARRVMRRHGWGDAEAPYEEVQRFFQEQLPASVTVYNEAHALLVRVGIEHCKARKPLCDGCPLQPLLPDGAPCTDVS